MSTSTQPSEHEDTEPDRGAILAEFTADLHTDDLPAPVLAKVKELFIDTVGVALGALDKDHSRQARAVVAAGGSAPQATVFGTAQRASIQEAAFANGVAAHGIDFDDTHKFVHPGCAVVPAVMAVAEQRDISGTELMASLVAGYEVSIRAAFAGGVEHRNRGFHPTGTCNVFGSAAGAARAMRLNAHETAAAIGAASSMASGTTQYRLDGAANKHLHGGLAARSGVLAAQLAEQGFHGTANAIDGRLGYLNLYADGGRPDELTLDLGLCYEVLDTDIKPYPSCRQSHAPVDLAMEAFHKHGVTADKVERVTVHIYSYADKPWYTGNVVPASPLEAFLCIPYCVASVLLYGRLGLQEFTPEAMASGALAEAIGRVSVKADTALDKNWPDERGARLQIEMRGGETVMLATTNPSGSSDKPLTMTEILRKFDGLTDGILDRARRDDFLAAVEGMEKLASVKDIIRPLVSAD